MAALLTRRILIAASCLLAAALGLLWLKLDLPRFPGDPMFRFILFVAGSLNAIGVLFLGPKTIKALVAINSFCLTMLAVELFLAEPERKASRVRNSASIPDADNRDLVRRRFVANAPIMSDSEIVAIGDSQTRGINVQEKYSWPGRLARLCKCKVQNLGYGGLSPAQYWTLLQRATAAQPRITVIGLYLGNDIWDTFSNVYKDQSYKNLRSFKGAQIDDNTEIEAQSLLQSVKQFEQQYRIEHSDSLKNFWQHSSLRKLFPAKPRSGDGPFFFQKKAWAESEPRYGSIYDNGRVRTIMTSAYRLLGEDLNRPANREGFRILKVLLRKMQMETEKSDIRFLVALIPTKEMVFAELMKPVSQNVDSHFPKLIASETRIRNEISNFCIRNKIEFVDTLPALRKEAMNIQIYPESSDGHPIEAGYLQIAAAVSDRLNDLSWISSSPP